ncbi:unnamed protein product [Durusdinium trenchii]|uniref:EF-hand domain-containing protein n=1 Tax=Durusdinium trenchii TaxID=1381693 RepID=A0ABP0N1B1_9DINO
MPHAWRKRLKGFPTTRRAGCCLETRPGVAERKNPLRPRTCQMHYPRVPRPWCGTCCGTWSRPCAARPYWHRSPSTAARRRVRSWLRRRLHLQTATRLRWQSVLPRTSWACELGELLQSAPEWTVRQHGEWALCSSLERFSAFLRWLTGIATRSCSELSGASASTSALEEHSLCLRSIARVVAKMSSYMQGALGAMDPARPLTGRLGQVAEGLEEAADDLAQKAARLLQKGKHGKAAPDTSKSVTAGELRESQRRSILGLLAGHPNWQLPHEVQRQESLLQHLQEQREGGSGAARTQGMQDRRPRTTVLAFGASRARAEAQAQADFAELDQNKDGVVSIDEWRRARVPAQR